MIKEIELRDVLEAFIIGASLIFFAASLWIVFG